MRDGSRDTATDPGGIGTLHHAARPVQMPQKNRILWHRVKAAQPAAWLRKHVPGVG